MRRTRRLRLEGCALGDKDVCEVLLQLGNGRRMFERQSFLLCERLENRAVHRRGLLVVPSRGVVHMNNVRRSCAIKVECSIQ